jgi:probable rRNA maturation factor
MILLDPDLDPDPAPKATPAKREAARGARQKSPDFRLPSARSLALYLKAAQEVVRLKGQVTVLLTTDAAIRDLNRRFRGKNKATDVLSFPAEGLGAEGIAGDMAISVATAMRQADWQGHSLATEIKVLMLHGLLHLAGCDHEADAGQMARRERVLRGRLRLPLGLIERAGAPTLSTGRTAGPSTPVAAATSAQDDRKNGARGIEVSHPFDFAQGRLRRKNKDAARVGHPRTSGAKAHKNGKHAFMGLKAPAPSNKSANAFRGLKAPAPSNKSANAFRGLKAPAPSNKSADFVRGRRP